MADILGQKRRGLNVVFPCNSTNETNKVVPCGACDLLSSVTNTYTPDPYRQSNSTRNLHLPDMVSPCSESCPAFWHMKGTEGFKDTDANLEGNSSR